MKRSANDKLLSGFSKSTLLSQLQKNLSFVSSDANDEKEAKKQKVHHFVNSAAFEVKNAYLHKFFIEQARFIDYLEKNTQYRNAFNFVYNIVLPLFQCLDVYKCNVQLGTICIVIGRLYFYRYWNNEWSPKLEDDCPDSVVQEFCNVFGIRTKKGLYSNLMFQCAKEIIFARDNVMGPFCIGILSLPF